MSNKKWREEIQEKGVLCKTEDGLMINVSQVDDTFAFNAQDRSIKIIRLTPVTAQEWWGFAPWQPIETAPLDTKILLIDEENDCQVGFIYSHNDGTNNIYCSIGLFEPKKWLPLPEVKV